MFQNPALLRFACSSCDQSVGPAGAPGLCPACKSPLRAEYDLLDLRLKPAQLRGRTESLWRYRELLPFEAPAAARGEGFTPLLPVEDGLFLKDEGVNPTGSIEARAAALCVAAARSSGLTAIRAVSTGPLGSALAAACAAARLPLTLELVEGAPAADQALCQRFGAQLRTVGSYDALERGAPAPTVLDATSLLTPFSLEGKKTVAFELFEQLGGAVPDAVLVACGTGSTLSALWRGFEELRSLGFATKLPRLLAVQSEDCAPVVGAFRASLPKVSAWPRPHSAAPGLRIPHPRGGAMALAALRATGGDAVSAVEADLPIGQRELSRHSGADVSLSGGALWAALPELRKRGAVRKGEKTVLINPAAGALGR